MASARRLAAAALRTWTFADSRSLASSTRTVRVRSRNRRTLPTTRASSVPARSIPSISLMASVRLPLDTSTSTRLGSGRR